MRVLLIHQAFVSPDEAGGTRHYELGKYVVSSGHQFTIVASDLSYLTGKAINQQRSLVFEQQLNGIRILRAFTYPSLHRSFAWRVISFLSFMVTSVWAGLRAGPIDLVMGTTPPIFQAVSAWLVALLRRRPFLLEIRDLWPTFAIDMGVLHNPLLIILAKWLERFLYAQATHLLVNSPAYRDYLIQKGVRADKITLIPNGVTTSMFDPDAKGEEVRQNWQLNGEFVVTYAGALGLANDIPTILRAAEQLREQTHIHFLLVGDGKERQQLERTAQQLKLSNVTFTGSVAKSRMPAVLAASDACVATLQNIPMFTTTYPNKVFDYMAAGRPTILGIDGVIRQVIEDAQAGIFVQPGDDKALANAVLTLANDRTKAQAIGASARAYVQKHFERSQQAEQFAELLEKFAR
jgi:glycosyltransferase involved in cell wall biosynthesis